MTPQNSVEKFTSWCKSTLLPYWATHGIDQQKGGFFEQLQLDGTPDRTEVRRVRVASRQIYAFSHAHHLGWLPAKHLILGGVDWLLDRAWAKNGEPGFLHLVSDAGQPLDQCRDLYDHAFHILGLSWAYRATGDAQVLSAARRTFDFVEEALGSTHGGWNENLHRTLPRRQNPHMHMFEALLALYQASKDTTYLKRADEIANLMQEKWIDRETKLLVEHFDEKWRPQRPIRIEPGHMAEWSWLLHHRDCFGSGSTNHTLAQSFLMQAKRIGQQTNGLLIDACDKAGKPTQQSCRLWSQTEWLKALMIANESNSEVEPAITTLLDLIFEHYLNLPNPALWIDAITPESAALSNRVPASIVYHLVSAATEANRIFLEPKLKVNS